MLYDPMALVLLHVRAEAGISGVVAKKTSVDREKKINATLLAG